jgi:hypothetical protein
MLMDQPAEHVPPFDRRLSRPSSLRCSGTGGYGQAQSPTYFRPETLALIDAEPDVEEVPAMLMAS